MTSFCSPVALKWLLFLLLVNSPPTLSFPSMLVESKSGCWIDLTDKEEVVMNHPIIMYSESSRPDLFVAVVSDKQEFLNGPLEMKPDVQKYMITVVNPGKALPDVQYALETTEGASFVGGGCDGKRRTHGRLSDSTPHELIVESSDKEIRVVAAWAGGHEAVQLTDVLHLVPPENKGGTTVETVDDNNKGADTEKYQEEQVIGLQEVEKHEPHDVGITERELPPLKVGKDEEDTDKKGDEENAHHKDTLDEEIKVLREEVQDLGKNHTDIEDRMHATIQRAKHEKPKLVDNDNKDSRQTAQDSKKETAHEETIQRFKNAYKEKHGAAATPKRPMEADLKETSKLHDTIQRFKESYREKHKDPNAKPYKKESKEEIYKRMKTEMFSHGKVARREPTLSFVERVRRRYNAKEEHDNPVMNMRNYMYGVIFFIAANVCVMQTCIWIGKRDKRRNE